MEKFQELFMAAASNRFIRIVLIAIVCDTIFGVLRAIKEKKFNSNFGIDGAIRKCGMIVSIFFFVLVDAVIHLNLIGFIPKPALEYMNIDTIGLAEFFCILYIVYETVSILKNMTLCGLPVRKVWESLKKVLGKYTDELPDDDEIVELDKVKTYENQR